MSKERSEAEARLKLLAEAPAYDCGPTDSSMCGCPERKFSAGLALIAAERQGQIEGKGWAPERDEQWTAAGQLARAALCYLLYRTARETFDDRVHVLWPWAPADWRPTSPIRDLTRAGALIAAELDRLLREKGGANANA